MNRKSYAISFTIVLVLTLWMGSGYLFGNSQGSVPEAPAATAPDRMTVQVRSQTAEDVARRLESQGEALPNRRVRVRAETTGRVETVVAEKGAEVAAGDPLLRIAMGDRQARLERAEAAVDQREADYEAAQRLGDQGFQAKTRVREAFAALQAARSDLESIREDIANTTVRAPFDGIVDDRMVEVGDYLSPGDPAVEVVETDPLRVAINIAQQDVGRVDVGATAEVSLATGETLEGEITFIAPAAESRTRTFRAEVRVANPDRLPAGVSATVRVPLSTVRAHFVSPAVLALDADGVLGAKTVDDNDRVRFHPVTIVRSEANGVWVTGLPEEARIITVGQGFVKTGEAVRTVAARGNAGMPGLTPLGGAPVPGSGG